ncbi:MAG: response regulator [Gammaproteobacteria bacterium]
MIKNRTANILVIDDERDILELVDYNLRSAGYRVRLAENAEDGLEKIRHKLPDLLVLDLMLPGLSGLDLCRTLKSDRDTGDMPIVMLTARGDEFDIVTGLELGADDYITKPFSPKVLLTRIAAVLRRAEESDSSNQSKAVHYHNIYLHPGRREVKVDNQEIELTYTEFEILNLLINHPGWVFTRNQIVDKVRGDNYPVTERSVDFQFVGLRKKLGDAGKFIQTVRGVGYRMIEI